MAGGVHSVLTGDGDIYVRTIVRRMPLTDCLIQALIATLMAADIASGFGKSGAAPRPRRK